MRIPQFDTEHLAPAGSNWVARVIIAPALGEPDSERDEFKAGDTLQFSAGARGTDYLSSGWMPSEGWGTWTLGRDPRPGVLTLPINEAAVPARLEITFWGQLGPGLPAETFRVQVAGDPVVLLRIDKASPIETKALDLGPGALAMARQTGALEVQFWAPEGKSPAEMGLNNDQRVLGLGLRQIILE